MSNTNNQGKLPEPSKQHSFYNMESSTETPQKPINVQSLLHNPDLPRAPLFNLQNPSFNTPLVSSNIYRFNSEHNMEANQGLDNYTLMNLDQNNHRKIPIATESPNVTNQIHFNTNFDTPTSSLEPITDIQEVNTKVHIPTKILPPKNEDQQNDTEKNDNDTSNILNILTQKVSVKKRKVINKPEITKNGKYRERNPEKWLCNQRRKLYAAGKAYLNRKGKFIPEREMKPPCTCKMRCYDQIPEEKRVAIFNNYWSEDTNNDLKRQYIRSCIETFAVNRRRKRTGTRTKDNTLKYTFLVDGKRVKVCKVMFLNTLSISNTVVNTIIKKKTKEGGMVELDRRGKHEPSNKIPEAVRDTVRNHIASLATYEGIQNNLKKSKKKADKPELSVEKMYSMYIQYCIDNAVPCENIAKKWLYSEIFNKNS